jgi:hypothetical protein
MQKATALYWIPYPSHKKQNKYYEKIMFIISCVPACFGICC